MSKWLSRVILLGALIVFGVWGWHVFFPSAESVIRKRLNQLAKVASFSSNAGLIAKAYNASLLGEFFTSDVQVTVEVPGTQHTISGRDDLLQAAVGARSAVGGLTVDFPDINVNVAPDKSSAVVNLTARGKVPGQRDYYLQELRVRMVKIKRDWLIDQVQTVKTLSWDNRELLTSALYLGNPSRPGDFAAPRFVEARAIFVVVLWGEAWVERERNEYPFPGAAFVAASAAAARASHRVLRGRVSSRPACSQPGA
jgi:hypothetical protein